MTDDKVSNQRHLQDPERCLTRHLGETLDFSDCLVKGPYACEYSVRYTSGVYCRHPDRRSFEATDPR